MDLNYYKMEDGDPLLAWQWSGTMKIFGETRAVGEKRKNKIDFPLAGKHKQNASVKA